MDRWTIGVMVMIIVYYAISAVALHRHRKKSHLTVAYDVTVWRDERHAEPGRLGFVPESRGTYVWKWTLTRADGSRAGRVCDEGEAQTRWGARHEARKAARARLHTEPKPTRAERLARPITTRIEVPR